MTCPDDNALSELLAGVLPTDEIDRLDLHVDACATCRQLLVELASALEDDEDDGLDEPADPDAAADMIELSVPIESFLGGRYVPERILGAGGMSIVYEARDQALERRVALKVMLDAPEDVRARLRREARALGMLSHPNVVDVYDVDLSDGNAFLACELVDGGSLRTWLSESPRTWQEVLGVIVDAARGLEAAHRVGLVHRDVTPNNVLIGADGHGTVADFGLARLPDSLTEITANDDGHPVLGRPRTGHVGTPGYVAPEIVAGLDATPASDQYSLCVTAYHALHGVLPGQTREGPPSREVPRAVDRVLERGLRRDPTRRYASVATLRRALQRVMRSPGRPRWGLPLVAAGGLAVTMAAVGEPEPGPCTAPVAALRSDVDLQHGDAAPAPRVLAVVERYADAWTSVRRESCDAAEVGALDPRALDLRLACLDARRRDFVAFTRALQRGSVEPGGIEHDLHALEGLHPASDCEDDPMLARGASLPPARIASSVDELRGKLAEARAARHSEGDDRARALLDELARSATALGHDPLTAEVMMVRGSLLRDLGEYEQARNTLQSAAHLAAGSNTDTVAGWAWLQLLALEGYDEMDYEAAERIEPMLDATLARLGHPASMMAQRALSLGAILDRQSRYDEAETHYADVLELIERRHGRDSLHYADALSNVGVHHARAMDLDRARDEIEDAAALIRELVGPNTPREGDALSNLASLELALRDYPKTIERAKQALAVQRTHLQEDDPRIAMLVGLIGEAYVYDQQPHEGIPYLEDKVELTARRVGDDNPVMIDAWFQLAVAYAVAQRLVDAEQALAHATEHLDAPGVSSEQRGVVWTERGRLSAEQQDFDAALVACQKAVDALSDPPRQPWLGEAIGCRDAAAQGRMED